jgi:hypothetical protein
MRATNFVLYLVLAAAATAGTITLSTDIELPAPNPDPNQIITVFIHSDTPVLFMNLVIRVNGDATIAGVMDETTCAPYGWDSGSIVTCTVNPDNSIELFALNWNENNTSTVGYLQFRCNSGFAAVYLDAEASTACSWSEDFTCSTEPVSVGTLIMGPLLDNKPKPAAWSCTPSGEGPALPDSVPPLDMTAVEISEDFSVQTLEETWLPTIDITSDITTNQVWEPNCIYLVRNNIQVQALLVIQPGTIVLFDEATRIDVNNGGTVISRGLPDNPIIYRPNFNWPIGWWFIAIAEYGAVPHFYCPLRIHETASPATTMTYSFVEGATVGVVTRNIRLDNPIENNLFIGNDYGVIEIGPKMTDIRNNLMYFQEICSVEAFFENEPNDIPDLDNVFKIEQNTFNAWQYYGIKVHGISDVNAVDLPTVEITNNIIAEIWECGITLYDGAMMILVQNNGYYGNTQDKHAPFPEYKPIYSFETPWSMNIGDGLGQHNYLLPDCNFVDVGTVPITQTPYIGTSTRDDATPDTGMIDLGYHHNDWHCTVASTVAQTTIDDVTALAEFWLTYDPADPNSPNYVDPNFVTDPNDLPGLLRYEGDWDNNSFVDYRDLALLAQLWQAAPIPPAIPASISSPNEYGFIHVQVQDANDLFGNCYLMVDGQFVEELWPSGDGFEGTVSLPHLLPGTHEARIIATSAEGVLCPMPVPFELNSTLGPCITPLYYEPNQPLPFSVMTDADSIQVSAYEWGDVCVWQETFDNSSLSGRLTVPAAIVEASDIAYLEIKDTQNTSTKTVPVEKAEAKSSDIRALIVLPSFSLNRTNSGLIRDYQDLLENRGIPYKVFGFAGSSVARLTKYAAEYNIQYLIVNAHGYYEETDKKTGATYLRTVIGLGDGHVLADKASNYTATGSYQYLPRMTADLEAMPTWKEMGFTDLRYAHFDCCYSGRLYVTSTNVLTVGTSPMSNPHNDMSIALGLKSTNPQFYFGWGDKFVGGFLTPTSGYSAYLLDSFENGNDLTKAISDADSWVRTKGYTHILNEKRFMGQGLVTGTGFRIY